MATRLAVYPETSSQARRPPRSVRLSITDRCDLACLYCRAQGGERHVQDRLDLAAWRTVIQGLLKAGIRRVRITGGEPLLHRDLVRLVGEIAASGAEDLALTTNGTRLCDLAPALREAGLRRLNVSLDTLDAQRFAALTRGGRLDRVLQGIDRAVTVGFDEIKLNTVVLRGTNDDEVERITRFAWDRGLVPRFLELMPVGEGAKFRDRLVSGQEVRERLAQLLTTETARGEENRGPAVYVRGRHDPKQRVGFITGATHAFCKACDRLRVTCDGAIHPCLAMPTGLSIGKAARAGDVMGVVTSVRKAWEQRPDGETWRGCSEDIAQQVSLRHVGG
ncbi:MAG: GTP 3',8-cyclase MoaA [Myxococcales bacterium]